MCALVIEFQVAKVIISKSNGLRVSVQLHCLFLERHIELSGHALDGHILRILKEIEDIYV